MEADPHVAGGNRHRVALAAILIVFVALYLADLRHPFTRVGESHAAAIAKYARNYVRFGVLPHKLMMINVSGPSLERYDRPKDHYYVDHPPLGALWISAFFAVLGDSETVYRLAVLPFLLAALLAFHRIAAGLLSPRGAWTATILFAFNPMMLHYGSATAYVAVPLALNLLAIVLYERWVREPSFRSAAPIVVLQVLSCYSGWQGYYLAPTLLGLHLVHRRRPLTLPLAMIGINFVVFAVYLGHAYWLDPEKAHAFHWLLNRREHWSSVQSFTIGNYVQSVGRAAGLLFTLPLVIAGLAAPFGVLSPRTRAAALPLLPFLLLGLDALLFPNITISHEYYIFHFVVYLALAGGALSEELLRPRPSPWSRAAAACAVVLAFGFLAQSAAVTLKRKTEIGVNAYHEGLALAIRDHTAPNDRVLVGIKFQTNRGGYTAGRCITLYTEPPHRFATEDGSPVVPAPDPATLVESLRRSPRFEVLVMTSRETVASEIPYFRELAKNPAAFNEVASFWGIPFAADPMLVELDRRFRKRQADGFIFYDLAAPKD